MNKFGNVFSINISEEKGKLKSIENGTFKENHGLLGDIHSGSHNRQVSLLSIETIQKLKSREVEGLCINKFKGNIITKDIFLYDLPIGTKVKMGETIQEITQIGKKCYEGCKIKSKLDCVLHKEVIFTKILIGGEVKLNDKIEIIENK